MLWPALAAAQPKVGVLWIDAGESPQYVAALREALKAKGHAEGRSFAIDDRSLVRSYEELPAAADRLVKDKAAVIVAFGGTALQAARKATASIPIVMVTGGDPVKLGLAASLSRPGGNVTGVTFISQELSGKRLELLKEIAPSVQRVAALHFAESRAQQDSLRQYEASARAMGLELRPVAVRGTGDIDAAIAAAAKSGVQAMVVIGGTLFNANRRQVIAAIERARLPAVYANREYVEDGGLAAYGTNFVGGFRLAGDYVDRILKGANPAEMPIEQPTTFELAVNARAAKALGLKLPPPLLLRADRLIE